MTKDGNRVLVSGSTGFIGSALMRRLAAEEIPAIGCGPGMDLTEWDQVKGLAGFDAVIHLAARTQVSLSNEDPSYEAPRRFLRNNFLATLHCLELARRNHARFILASSYVYGVPQYLPVDERHPTSALNPYMASKLMTEDLCASYQRDFGVPLVVLRIFNAIGPGQRGDFLFPTIFRGLAAGRISLRDPKPRRDFVFVDDVANALVAALEWRDSTLEIFNIGSGSSISVEQLVEMVVRFSGRATQVEYEPLSRPSEIPDTAADIRKAARLLRWEPQVTLENGILRMLAAREVE